MSSNGRRYSSPDDAFAARVRPEGDCLIWTGSLTKGGYGKLWVTGRVVSVHRYAWEKANGRTVPGGMQVDHSCYNRACVAPAHLRLASSSQNNSNRSRCGQRTTKHPRGVSLDRGRWKAEISIGGKVIGRYGFDTAEEAAVAAQELRDEHFGDFAGKSW